MGEKNWPRPVTLALPVRPAPKVGPTFTDTREYFLLRRWASSTAVWAAAWASLCATVWVCCSVSGLGRPLT